MFQVSNLTATTKEYLEEAEQKAMEETQQLGLDTKRFKEFCEGIGQDPKKPNIKLMEAYLNNNKAHYKAEFGGELSKKLKLTYSTEAFSKLLNGELPDNLIKEAKQTYSNVRKNGKILNSTDGEKLGLDIVLDAPKSASLQFMKAKTKEERDFIISCIAEARDEILNKKVAPLLTPSGGVDGKIISTDIAYASFVHMETRPLKADNKESPNLHTHQTLADPHIHFHVSLAKATGYTIEQPDGKIVNKILANDPSKVFEQQLEISAAFDTLVQQKLSQRYNTEEAITKEGFTTYRLSGYTQEIEDRFSQRGNEVKKFKEKMKKEGVIITGDSQAERLMTEAFRKQSANQKNDLNATELLEALQSKVEKGITDEESLNIRNNVNRSEARFTKTEAQIKYNEILGYSKFDTQGLVKESDLRTEIIKQIRFKEGLGTGLEALDKEVDLTLKKLQGEEYGTKRLIKMENGNYTTLELAINERVMVEQLKELHQSTTPLNKKQYNENKALYLELINKYSDKGIKFNEGQLSACKQLLQEKNLQLCIGNAGVGKTATYISFVNDFYRTKGRKVLGVAVQGTTTGALAEANIENRLNTSQFITKAFKNGKPNKKFLDEFKGGVICIDEASMLAPKDMAKLAEWANLKDNFIIDKDGNKQQAKIIMVGDGKQILNVGAGANPFTITQDSIVNKEEVSLISQNMRQKTDLMKEISNLYMEAKTQDAVNLLEKNNLLFKGVAESYTDDNGKKVRVSAEQSTMNALIKDYLENPLEKKDKMIIAGTNKEIKYINDELRTADMKREAERQATDPNYKSKYDLQNQHYIEVCRINGNNKQFDNRAFCIGEQIILQKGLFEKQGRKEVKIADNSEMGIIKSITPLKNGSFDIELDIKTNQERAVKFNTKDFNQFDHTYAISSNRSQGQSVESVQVLLGASSFASNRNKNYVDGSRMKTEFKAYIVESDLGDYVKNGEKAIVKESTINDKICDKAVEQYIEQRAVDYRKAPPTLTPEQQKLLTITQENQRQETIERTIDLGLEKIKAEAKTIDKAQVNLSTEEVARATSLKEPIDKLEVNLSGTDWNEFHSVKENEIINKGTSRDVPKAFDFNKAVQEAINNPITISYPELKDGNKFSLGKIDKALSENPEIFKDIKDELIKEKFKENWLEAVAKNYVYHSENKLEAVDYLKDNNLLTDTILTKTIATTKGTEKEEIVKIANEYKDYSLNQYTRGDYGTEAFKETSELIKTERLQQEQKLEKVAQTQGEIKRVSDNFSNASSVEAMFKYHSDLGAKMTIEKCSEALKDDPDFMTKACKHFGENLKYGSDKIKQDINVCREAVKQKPDSIKYASPSVQELLEQESQKREEELKAERAREAAKKLADELAPKPKTLTMKPQGRGLSR